jgi:hypothetical protein
MSRMSVCALTVAEHADGSNRYYSSRRPNSPACSPLPSAVIFSIRVDDISADVKVEFGFELLLVEARAKETRSLK